MFFAISFFFLNTNKQFAQTNKHSTKAPLLCLPKTDKNPNKNGKGKKEYRKNGTRQRIENPKAKL